MAAPLVILGKVAVQAALKKVQEKYPGGVMGLIATIVIISVVPTMIYFNAIVGIIGSLSTGAAVRGDECLFVNDFSYVSSESDDTGGSGPSGTDTLEDPPDADTLLMPLANIQVTSNYGPRTPPKLPGGGYGSANHLGTDYRGTAGTPIYAVADGIVYQARYNSGHGYRVVIKHKIQGKVWYVLYAHMPNATQYVKAGDSVKAGQRVGSIGTTGSSQSPHLHMEVWDNSGLWGSGSTDPHKWLLANGALKTAEVSGTSGNILVSSDGIEIPDELKDDADIQQLLIDCNIVADESGSDDGNGVGAGAWGGHANGKIPTNLLCQVRTSLNKHLLRCDATENFDELNAAYRKEFGSYINITDSYRTYEAQVQVRQNKPTLAAVPGTSNHGWGLALDLASQINVAGSPSYNWMRENGPKYGWVHPTWARSRLEGGTKPEPWHWEFVGRSDSQGLGTVAEAKSYAKRAMKEKYSWGDKEYSCLVNVWEKESGWNYKAANPISTARGIPQAMMSVHFGFDWANSVKGKEFLNTPSVQIDWGLNYIKGRYGTPCKTWDFWQKNSHY